MTTTSSRPRQKLKPGAVVRCRTRRYLVEDVQAPQEPGADTVLSLACMEDDAIGQRLTVFREREIDFEVLGESSWEAVAQRGFDQPRQFAAYLNTLRWNCVTATDAELFQAPYRAGIDVKAYQLEPLRKALQMPRVGLFIADDVGLGKTIEAGLILREMLLRQRIKRVVISCPPSVLRQWQEEMASRFGLAFTVMDRAYVAKVRQERGYGTNPWSTHSRFLISHALLRNSEYSAPLRVWLEQGKGGEDQAPVQSLLILDEAHNAAPASNTLRYAIDSGLTRSLRDLAPLFEHRIFLSATPHNGHSNSFTALLELLDPARFVRGVPFEPVDLETVLVRRLKDDLRRIGEEFPERIVEPLSVPEDSLPADTPELELSRLLQKYRKQREQRLIQEGATKRQLNADRLVITNLQKRLLSSIEAFARTLKVHRKSLDQKQEQRREALAASGAQLDLLLGGADSDSDLAELTEDELLNLEEAQTRAALRQTFQADQSDLALLERMGEIAAANRNRPDPRIKLLETFLRTHLCPDLGEAKATWNPTRLLIFTDYVDTKRYLERQLRDLLGDDDADRRIASFTGGMSEDNRERLKAQFNADPDQEPLRILIATDAAREGVNLQNHCKHLIHFDIPWNPSKLEQRNGRIDRKLQRAPQVWCHYFVLEDRPEDRVMDVLVKKTEVIRQELGSLSPLLQRQVDEVLEGGIDTDNTEAVQQQLLAMDSASTDRGAMLNRAREELEASRRVEKLEQQQDELRHLLAKSHDWLGFDDEPFRDALNCSLDLLGVSGLVKGNDEKGQPCWRLDHPEALVAGSNDRSWENTLDSLRGVWDRKTPLWQWRQEHPVRPVIFSDPGRLNAEAVHLHLEHRLVQRLLSRFLSQGFLHHELSRACVLASPDPQPKVLVLGRLSLFGQGATRLHDELISVIADWHPCADRAAVLKPLAGAQRDQAWATLTMAMEAGNAETIPTAVRSQLQAEALADVAALKPALDEVADQAQVAAAELLKQRGATEADALKEVLRAQRKRINATVRQRNRDLARLDRQAAAAEPTALIPGLEEQLDVPAPGSAEALQPGAQAAGGRSEALAAAPGGDRIGAGHRTEADSGELPGDHPPARAGWARVSLAHQRIAMALRFHLLQFIRRLASRIAGLAERWASNLEPSRALAAQPEGSVVSRASVGSSEPSTDEEKPYELIPLLNDAGEVQAGAFTYGLAESTQMIEFLRTERVYGSGTAGSQSVSGVVGDFAAKLTPSLAAAVQAGQLMRIVGPPAVVDGLAKGTMTLMQSGGANLGGVLAHGSSKIAGQARFVPAAGVLAPLVVYQAVHAIVGTQQLNEINRRLANIERTLSRIVQRQNAKDIGEVIAAASTLQDILAEHAHSGYFNAQMQDRISHCERDLRAHLERLMILKANFHDKITQARQRAQKREKALELAALIKEEGEQFGQDIRLLVALCAAVIQLEHGLMLIALEHHPESLAYRQKQMTNQINQCRETLADMLDLSEIKGEIKLCLDDMNWWQRNLFDRGAADMLKQASELPLEAAPVKSLREPTEGGMLIWRDPDHGIQMRAIAAEETETRDELSDAVPEGWPEPTYVAFAPSTSLLVGETYKLDIHNPGSLEDWSNDDVPIRILKCTGDGEWIGMRMDIPEIALVEIWVEND